jgi:glycyl-tRNA synthetase (class II)
MKQYAKKIAVAAMAKRRGYYWSSYEIYGGLSVYIPYATYE